MKQSQKIHLPVMGVGPVYVVSIVIVTIIAILFGRTTGNIADQSASQSFTLRDVFPPHTPLSIFFTTLGVLIILLGLIIYILAIKIKITKAIKENRLLTTGVYSIVRNPIYSAWLLLCTGALLCSGSLLLTLLLFFIFWAYLTILMKHTEEKWLTKLYGAPYTEYCKKVNRCLPWFPKK
ncbi:isoprenylcysteine carboxylmethyltransferase family protein [Candidatus Saccharibacteria bacterium]|nr:isoprenylcysteine carboxylmethyltransferase family protein [Candidatus Saccharibacteria bacterium]